MGRENTRRLKSVGRNNTEKYIESKKSMNERENSDIRQKVEKEECYTDWRMKT